MFKSARLKLTFFYLGVIVVLSLTLTLGARWLAEVAFLHSNKTQRGVLRTLVQRQVSLPLPDTGLNYLQKQQADKLRHDLDLYVLYVNLVALAGGGLASYWFAGRALRPIEEAHEQQTRFASDASHELRTPLTAMQTENEVFLRQKHFSETEARDQITSNLEEVQRLEQLVTSLLAMSQYSQDEPLILKKVKSVDVQKLTLERLAKVQPLGKKRVSAQVSAATIVGDKTSLAQILTIFLDNAIKYSPPDSQVRLIGQETDVNYQFIVEDQGPGIAAEDLPHIFERLYRGDKSRTKAIAGHGLGLSLAVEIAKVNNAGLSVANVTGGGARFSLTVELA